jgi:aminopeptidase N
VLSRPPEGEPGWWRFAPTPPIPPWLSRLAAGSFSGSALSWPRARRDPLEVTIEAFWPAAGQLERVKLAELLKQALRYYEGTLGVPYPYGVCNLVFGPISPALAYSASGLIIIQDQVLDEDPDALFMATVVAHELAHAWFGGLVTMPGDQMWLDEALTTYISRTAVAQIIPGAAPWATATSAALPDASYATDATAIRRLEDVIGPQAVLDGLGTLLRRHAHGDATKDDLIRYWSQASGHDLRGWADEALLPGEGD